MGHVAQRSVAVVCRRTRSAGAVQTMGKGKGHTGSNTSRGEELSMQLPRPWSPVDLEACTGQGSIPVDPAAT